MSLLGVGCGLDQSPTPLLYFLLSDQQEGQDPLVPLPLSYASDWHNFWPKYTKVG